MNKMRHHSQKLLDQVVLVSQELIRIAITWLEEWYNTLEVFLGLIILINLLILCLFINRTHMAISLTMVMWRHSFRFLNHNMINLI